MSDYQASRLIAAMQGCAWMIVIAICFHGCVTSTSTIVSVKAVHPTTREVK